MALAKRTDKQFNVRMPHEMHAQLADAADKNNRSINSEIVARLTVTLFPVTHEGDWRGYVSRKLDEVDRLIAEARAEGDEHTAEDLEFMRKMGLA